MAYPEPSTALSGLPGSFWFVREMDGRQNVCSTNGYSLLSNVQAAIRSALAITGPLASFGGTTIQARDIANIAVPIYGDEPTPQSTAGWDVPTLRGLYALIQRYRPGAASRPGLAAIEADARRPIGSSLSPMTVQLATWLAYESTGTDSSGNPTWGQRGAPADVGFATNRTIFPLFGVMPPLPVIPEGQRGGVIVDSPGNLCTLATVPIATESPIRVTTTFSPNALLILLALAGAAGATIVLTKRAPRLEQIRGRR